MFCLFFYIFFFLSPLSSRSPIALVLCFFIVYGSPGFQFWVPIRHFETYYVNVNQPLASGGMAAG